MGLNIIAYIVKEKVHDEDGPGWYYDADRYEDWDSCRHSGDNDFAQQEFFETMARDEDCTSLPYYRVKDFLAARVWVRHHVVEINQARLLNLIDAMEADKRLWLYFSY